MKSDSLKIGTQNAPHRALYHALGLTEEEIERPLVGIVSSYNEIVPGHMNIDKIVDAVKIGVAMAGGTPIVFPAIAVCDGIAMGHTGMKYSLVTRDLIADSTEAMALAHGFDALVMVPNCYKGNQKSRHRNGEAERRFQTSPDRRYKQPCTVDCPAVCQRRCWGYAHFPTKSGLTGGAQRLQTSSESCWILNS